MASAPASMRFLVCAAVTTFPAMIYEKNIECDIYIFFFSPPSPRKEMLQDLQTVVGAKMWPCHFMVDSRGKGVP